MRSRAQERFQTVKTEGGLLPADLLARIAAGDPAVGGLAPEAYHLAKSERLNEAANRAWNRLQGAWEGFKAGMAKLPESDAGTSLTRERWLLILFQELGYGRLQAAKAVEVGGKTYPVSHVWQATPIHLVSFRQELDRRTPGARGAARVSPHSLVQEVLNRSEAFLWGFISNGLCLRILRDNASLTRAACVEFDLQAMMDGEAYSDFFLLYLLCHESRVEVPEGKTPEHCWLEKWYNTSLQEGTRVLDRLRDGVEQSIEALGGGFLAHPANQALRERLRAGKEGGGIDRQDYYRQVLRVVYRLLFLFVAEDRDLLLLPAGSDERLAAARGIYAQYYSTQRLRRLAERRRSARHSDLYRALRLVFAKLHAGCPELALPALGSFLFSPEAAPDLNEADIANADLLAAVWYLTFTVDGNVRRSVDYRNLGPEEFGSVYESLLEMHPEVNLEAGGFKLNVAAGSERRTSGSYYTPTPLVNCLLDSALDPVLDEACKKPDPEKALLDLKVCDTACGSGHFLIAAAHRIAKRLASVRAGEDEPAPESIQHALRDVIGHCIYGVDINPMAVELCKINLWLEAIEPGKPLSFLDHHIQCGNSLLGTTPALLSQGIPDEAFTPIEGDVKEVCSALKRENKDERRGQRTLWAGSAPFIQLGNLAQTFADIDAQDDSDLQAVGRKERRYCELVKSAAYENARFLADAWCAAFVWPKTSHTEPAVTTEVIRRIAETPHHYPNGHPIREGTGRLRDQYSFFHWHLAFPDVFRLPGKGEKPTNEQTGWSGGFDVVLGNPPWEAVNADPVEFFATLRPEIAGAENQSERNRLVLALESQSPELYKLWSNHLRSRQAHQLVFKSSGRFPLGSYGKTNTFPLFTELSTQLVAPTGRTGIIVKTAIATDHDYNPLFSSLMRKRQVCELVDFENKMGIFPAVHQMERFCLLTLAGAGVLAQDLKVAFNLHRIEQVGSDKIRVSVRQIEELTGGTFQFPAIRSVSDLQILTAISRRKAICPLGNGNAGWGAQFAIVYDGGQVSDIALTLEDITDEMVRNVVPVYEGKMIAHFNHRSATYQGIPRSQRFGKTPAVRELTEADLLDPLQGIVPRYWVPQDEAASRLGKKGIGVKWSLMYGRKASANNSRSIIAAICPGAISNDTLPLLWFPQLPPADAAQRALVLTAVTCSFAFDFLARMRVVGTTFGKNLLLQMPVPVLGGLREACLGYEWERFLSMRTLELSYTAWDMEALARDAGCDSPPFMWRPDRRQRVQAELDAACFHIYLGSAQEWQKDASKELQACFPTPRHAVEYIMQTFPLIKERDKEAYGQYRTQDTILEIYDDMARVSAENAAAVAAGRKPTAAYQTRLDPPPGPPTDAAGNFIPMAEWAPAIWARYKNVIHPPREAARPAAARVVPGRVIGYVTLLLRTWDKPVTRQALEPALVLMLNDGIRKTLLGKKPALGPKAASRAMPHFVKGLDQLLAGMKDTGAVGIQKAKDGSFILSAGPNAVALNGFPAADRDRAREAIQGLEVLSVDTVALTLEDSSDAYCEVVQG